MSKIALLSSYNWLHVARKVDQSERPFSAKVPYVFSTAVKHFVRHTTTVPDSKVALAQPEHDYFAVGTVVRTEVLQTYRSVTIDESNFLEICSV